jgi:GTP cyclohydrolase II
MTTENVNLQRSNEEMDGENKKLKAEIDDLLARIDLNTILKDVDIEDLRLLAQNNSKVNTSIAGLINKWERLEDNK